MIVMGIDPGLANLGLGVVREDGKTPVHLHSQTVQTSSTQTTPQRLAFIYQAVHQAFALHQPQALALEGQFFQAQHAMTAFKVGEAVGVVLLAAAEHGVPVFEYSPKAVKQALVGTGNASKEQVIYMVRATLALPTNPTSSHSADALALALAHLASRRVVAYAAISRGR
jgi:crossover junction endodeoxyribonuclease RuvC